MTRPVEKSVRLDGPLRDSWGNVHIGIEADPLKIDRKDLGLAWNRTLDGGGLVVGDEATVTLNVAPVKVKREAAPKG